MEQVNQYFADYNYSDDKMKYKYDSINVNINSKLLFNEPNIVLSQNQLLCPMSLRIINNTLLITISSLPCEYEIGSRIVINGLCDKKTILRSFVNKESYAFELKGKYMTIYTNPNVTISDDNYDKIICLNNLFVNICGVKGVNDTHIGNIPINFINQKHKIIFVKSNDKFMIELPYEYIGPDQSVYCEKSPFNMTLIFNHYGGIVFNECTIYNICNISCSNIIVNLCMFGYLDKCFGNDCMTLARVIQEPKDQCLSKYTLQLPIPLYNVFMIKLIKPLFPQPDNISCKNDIIRWKNMNDGDKEYCLKINHGIYLPDCLANTIQTLLNKCASDNGKYSYTVTYSLCGNYINFTSKIVNILIKPILSVTLIGLASYKVIVKQENNMYVVGTKINVSGALTVDGVNVNGTFIISEIIDENTYCYVINNVNLVNDIGNTNGGNNVIITTPNIFKFNNYGFTDELCIKPNELLITDNNQIVVLLNDMDVNSNNMMTNINFGMCNKTCTFLVDNVFARLNLNLNTYVVRFTEPIKRINKIEIEFRDIYGNLYDFNDNYSFTLQFTTINEIGKDMFVT